MPYASLRGAEIYYTRTGEGPPVLFVHGMCGNADVWSDQLRRWSPEFTCIAYDRRGHTRSTRGDVDAPTVGGHADDATGLMTQLGFDMFSIVASSGGARVGVDVLRRHADRVRCAVLSEPPLTDLEGVDGEAFVAGLKPVIGAAMASGDPRAAVDAFFEAVCPGLWARLDDAGKEPYRANHREFFADIGMPPYRVSLADLERVDVPALIFSGRASAPFLRDVASTLARVMPNAKLVELPKCGHVTYAEAPEAFAAAGMAFVRERTGA